MQDDDLGSKMPDGDLEGLAAQNAYLQEALETCRRDISSMSHQACIHSQYELLGKCDMCCKYSSVQVAAGDCTLCTGTRFKADLLTISLGQSALVECNLLWRFGPVEV